MIKTKTIRKNSLQQTGKTKCKQSGNKHMRTKRVSKGKTMRGGSMKGMGSSAPKMKNYTKMKLTNLEAKLARKEKKVNQYHHHKEMLNYEKTNLDTVRNKYVFRQNRSPIYRAQETYNSRLHKYKAAEKAAMGQNKKIKAIKDAIAQKTQSNPWINNTISHYYPK